MKVVSYLKALGFSNDLSSFSERKRIQKIAYLLKQFDPSDADLRFGFNWYLHGPYSPQLASVLFNATPEDVASVIPEADLSVINKIRNFLAEDLYSVDSLELVVSVIYLIKHGQERDLGSRKQIEEFLLAKKPQFCHDEFERSWLKIVSSHMWDKELSKLHN
ncbi:MAG: hypothetical protein ABSF36_03310 [Candidatus Methanomethylicaceae archaeon]